MMAEFEGIGSGSVAFVGWVLDPRGYAIEADHDAWVKNAPYIDVGSFTGVDYVS